MILLKRVNIKENLFREGEYLVGFEQTGTHACYFLYGVLKTGEQRKMSPGRGHVEIISILEGEVEVLNSGKREKFVRGEGFVLEGEERVEVKATGGKPVIYVISGGHTDLSHH